MTLEDRVQAQRLLAFRRAEELGTGVTIDGGQGEQAGDRGPTRAEVTAPREISA